MFSAIENKYEVDLRIMNNRLSELVEEKRRCEESIGLVKTNMYAEMLETAIANGYTNPLIVYMQTGRKLFVDNDNADCETELYLSFDEGLDDAIEFTIYDNNREEYVQYYEFMCKLGIITVAKGNPRDDMICYELIDAFKKNDSMFEELVKIKSEFDGALVIQKHKIKMAQKRIDEIEKMSMGRILAIINNNNFDSFIVNKLRDGNILWFDVKFDSIAFSKNIYYNHTDDVERYTADMPEYSAIKTEFQLLLKLNLLEIVFDAGTDLIAYILSDAETEYNLPEKL